MNNYAELEKLQRAVSEIQRGLCADGMDFNSYLMLEDMVFNNQYDLGLDLIESGDLKISNENKLALQFTYEHAKEKYNMIASLDPLR